MEWKRNRSIMHTSLQGQQETYWSIFWKSNQLTKQKNNYRIYSIYRTGRLLNFWTLIVGAYSRWALIRGWALITFSPFSASAVCLFCYKIINGNHKSEEVTMQGFNPICKILWTKLRLREGLLLCLIWVCVGGSGVGWALIRGGR